MAATGKKITYAKNEVVFREGEAAECMYKVYYGSVSVYVNYQQRGQKLIARLGEDTYFGEMGLIDGNLRSATVVAETSGTILIEYPRSALKEMLSGEPDTFRALLTQMSENLNHLTDKFTDVCRTISEYKDHTENQKDMDPQTLKAIEGYAREYNEMVEE